MKSIDMINLLMSSPVVVALITVGATFLTTRSKKPLTDRDNAERKRQDDRDEKADEVYKISKNLDRHINNSDEPFRKQINDKLDAISVSISALTESIKSANMIISSLDDRIDSVESDVQILKEEISKTTNRSKKGSMTW